MNKKEFVAELASELNVSASGANTIVEAVFDLLVKKTVEVGKVKLPWGVFSLTTSKERKGRNPKTGDELTIPSKKKFKFRASKTLDTQLGN